MKKRILSLGILLLTAGSYAQDISSAIGLRFGENNGLGYEISYQHPMSDANRLELDLGIRNTNTGDTFKLSGLYHWVWKIEGGFNWFAGAGAGIGNTSYDVLGTKTNQTFVNADGTIGIEYNFDFPLQLSLDARPELGIINGGNNLNNEIALGIRYKF